MPNIKVAFDLGNVTGYAWAYDNKLDPARVRSLNIPRLVKRHNFKDTHSFRFMVWGQWLEYKFEDQKHRIIAVAFEEAFGQRSIKARQLYNGYRAILLSCTARYMVRCCGVNVTTIKKTATGNGNANKELMIAAAQGRLNYTGTDHNQADALWVMHLALQDPDFLGVNS